MRTLGLGAVMVLMAACGSSPSGGISVANAWSPPAPPVADTAVFYMTLNNSGPRDVLVSATSAACDVVELHDTIDDRGLLKMQQVEAGIPIETGESVRLELAGLHLMCIGTQGEFASGSIHPLDLEFSSGATISLDVEVGRP